MTAPVPHIARTSSPRGPASPGFPPARAGTHPVARRGLRVAGAALSALRQDGAFQGPSAIISERKMYEKFCGQRVGRPHGEQRGAAPIPGSIGRREGSDAGSQGYGRGFHSQAARDGGHYARNGAHGVARSIIGPDTFGRCCDARRSPYHSLTYPVTRRGLRVGLIFLLDFPAVATRAAGAFSPLFGGASRPCRSGRSGVAAHRMRPPSAAGLRSVNRPAYRGREAGADALDLQSAACRGVAACRRMRCLAPGGPILLDWGADVPVRPHFFRKEVP